MLDNEIKQGDICIYHYADGNGSVNIVEVVEIIDSDISKIKCVQVIHDNSGNGWFEYLLKTGHTMNASNKYLHKIYSSDLLNRQKAEVGRLQSILMSFTSEVETWSNKKGYDTTELSLIAILDESKNVKANIKAEAYKEFAEEYKNQIKNYTGMFTDDGFMVRLEAVLSAVDFIKNKLVGDADDKH